MSGHDEGVDLGRGAVRGGGRMGDAEGAWARVASLTGSPAAGPGDGGGSASPVSSLNCGGGAADAPPPVFSEEDGPLLWVAVPLATTLGCVELAMDARGRVVAIRDRVAGHPQTAAVLLTLFMTTLGYAAGQLEELLPEGMRAPGHPAGDLARAAAAAEIELGDAAREAHGHRANRVRRHG